MTEKQFLQLKSKLSSLNCPICKKQLGSCYYQKTNVFCYGQQQLPFEQVEFPNVEYLDIECPNCTYLMRFHLANFFKEI